MQQSMRAINLLIAIIYCHISYGQKSPQNSVTIHSGNVISTTDTLETKEIPLRLKDIVSKIQAINEVQSEHIGAGAIESDNYKNFTALKKNASIKELIQLTDNKNDVVACYAAMALADKSYPDLKTVFAKFLNTNKQVKTFSGCIKMENQISSELYLEYLNNIDANNRHTDKILLELDSIILFERNAYSLLITCALQNRIYQQPYKSQIEILAFEKGNNDAIYYLCNWHRAEYAPQLKAALLKYLKRTDFSRAGYTDYYNTIEQLFKFNDIEIRKEIIAKMKKDRHWEAQKERFKFILEDNYIYNIDQE